MLRSNLSILNRLMLVPLLAGLLATQAHAYVDLAPTLAKIISDSRKIALVEVVEFDRANHTVTLKEVRSLKGDASAELIKHDVAPADGTTVPRQVAQWAAPGARGVMFGSRATALVCVGQGWYQVRSSGEGVSKLGAERPDLPLAYLGNLSRLTESVELMIAGKDAVLTVVAFGAENEGASFDLALNRQNLAGLARIQRIRANLTMPGTVMGSSSNPSYFIGLGAVDESEVPQLREKLKSSDAMVRAESADDLRSLGRKASPATAELTGLLNDPAPRVRVWAASALIRMNPKKPVGLDILSSTMTGSDAALRIEAARATGLAGAAAGPLTPKLVELLKSKDEAARLAALQAICLLGPAAAVAAPAVATLLDEPDLAIDAADTLGRIGEPARPALRQLAKMLTHEQSSVRWAGVRAMSQIGGPDAYPAVEFMIKALPQATEVEGYNMMVYLSLLGPVALDALPTLQNTPIKNPVLPSSTAWAMQPDKYLPWQGGGGGRGGRGGGRGPGGPGGGGPGGGGGGGMGDIFSFISQDTVRELGYRLRPAATLLATKIMDNSAGEVPDWGWEILSCGPEEAIGVLAPHLNDQDLATRERATVALGYMGPAAIGAKTQLAAARDRAANPREKRLIEWAIRETERE